MLPQHKQVSIPASILFFVVSAVVFLTSCKTISGIGNILSKPISTPTTTASSTFVPTAAPEFRPTLTPEPTSTSLPTATPIPNPEEVQYGPGEVTIPVLLYHHVLVDPTSKGRYAVSLENFKAQMNYLVNHGYHAITVSEMVEAINNGKLLPSNPVVITFDDGNRDIYEVAYPVMKSLDYRATMYLIANTINADTNLTTEMIAELAQAGWEMGSHTMTHANLIQSNNPIYEICNSKRVLEAKTGLDIQSLAYPFGVANTYIKQMARDCGYTSGAGLDVWNTHTPGSLYFFSRREVQGDFNLDDFINLLTSSN